MTLVGLELPETEYKADLELLDRYQAYSTEVARLATLEVAALGFLLPLAYDNGRRTSLGNALLGQGVLLASALVLLASAVALCLSHRYMSTDAFASMIRAMRLSKLAATSNRESSTDQSLVDERRALFIRLRHSGRLIWLASFCLVAGTLCLAIAVLCALESAA